MRAEGMEGCFVPSLPRAVLIEVERRVSRVRFNERRANPDTGAEGFFRR